MADIIKSAIFFSIAVSDFITAFLCTWKPKHEGEFSLINSVPFKTSLWRFKAEFLHTSACFNDELRLSDFGIAKLLDQIIFISSHKWWTLLTEYCNLWFKLWYCSSQTFLRIFIHGLYFVMVPLRWLSVTQSRHVARLQSREFTGSTDLQNLGYNFIFG